MHVKVPSKKIEPKEGKEQGSDLEWNAVPADSSVRQVAEKKTKKKSKKVVQYQEFQEDKTKTLEISKRGGVEVHDGSSSDDKHDDDDNFVAIKKR
jgi:general stress protein YciG